jgi:hypothetical protein
MMYDFENESFLLSRTHAYAFTSSIEEMCLEFR